MDLIVNYLPLFGVLALDGFIVRNAYNDSTSILAGIEYSF